MHASLSFLSQSQVLIMLSSKHSHKFAIRKPNQKLEQIERNDYQGKLFILNRSVSGDDSETWNVAYTMDIARKYLYSGLNLIGSSHLHLFDSSLSTTETEKLCFIIGSINECLQENPKVDADQLKSSFGAIFHRFELCRNGVDSNHWNIVGTKRFIGVSNDFPKYVALGNNDDVFIVSQLRMKYNSFEESTSLNGLFV